MGHLWIFVRQMSFRDIFGWINPRRSSTGPHTPPLWVWPSSVGRKGKGAPRTRVAVGWSKETQFRPSQQSCHLFGSQHSQTAQNCCCRPFYCREEREGGTENE